MTNYNIETMNLENLMQKENYSFFVKKAENVFDVYTKNGDKEFHFLSETMGKKTDELLEKFLIDMLEISKIVISQKNRFYYHIALLMFLFLDINYGNLIQGGYTYCSHAQGFFTFFKKINDIKKYFEDNFQNNYELIQKAYNGYIQSKKDMSLFYKIPKLSIETIKKDAKPLILDKEIYFTNYELMNSEFTGALSKSDFHTIHATEFMKKFKDIDFNLKRLITIFQYFLLNKLGLSYNQRCFLCYAIYRFIEQKYEFSYF